MRRLNKPFNNRTAIRLALAGLTAALLAGCSSGVASYGDPFSNPFKDASRFSGLDPTPTGSLAEAAPVSPVVSHPLGSSIVSKPLAPVRPSFRASAFTPPAYHPVVAPRPEYADNFDQRPHDSPRHGSVVRTSHGVWSPVGGAHVYVGQADNARILASRYGVPAKALLDANGLRSPGQLRPGMRIVIPVYSAAGHDAARDALRRGAPREARLSDRDAREKLRFVKGPAGRPLHAKPGLEDRRQMSERRHEESRIKRQSRDDARSAALEKENLRQKTAERAKSKEKPVMARETAPLKRREADANPTGSLPPAHVKRASLSTGNPSPRFSWPARGRIIEGFRPGRNDGINIAVPDGTVVRAAAGGVVAYAGDELKGYGNLVLIRHPDGYVTAYANNAKLDVKRGQSVRRGQAIAESGQSGNVSSPQLHFELRKGQTPIDPTRYLAGL